MALFSIIGLNFLIISKEGFKERFENSSLNSNLILDNQFYQIEWNIYADQVGQPGFNSQNKIKILIIGNSFARDFFNLFNLNKDLFKKYEFGYINIPGNDIYLFEFLFN